MPRANRHFLHSEGCVWHITHRCHKGEFLLKFKKDKLEWLSWIYRAKRIYGLRILNYVVTSNHIHLLVLESGRPNDIARSIHLAAGQTAQRFNRRKERRGAFWQDRYQATAVDLGRHLENCMAYIDLNMVRAGVVNHPAEWPYGGYYEIQDSAPRRRIINFEDLMDIFHLRDLADLKDTLQNWADEAIRIRRLSREECWTQSIAVGGREFIERIKRDLREKGIGKKVVEGVQCFTLRERGSGYQILGPKTRNT